MVLMLCVMLTLIPMVPFEASAADDGGTVVGDFTVYGGTKGRDFSFADGKLTVNANSTHLTIKNTDPDKPTSNCIYVNTGTNQPCITLAGVNIESSCAFSFRENMPTPLYIFLAEGTKNILTSTADGHAGLEKNSEGELYISGGGELIATGAGDASNSRTGGAGIGGSKWKIGRKITIMGGKITATGYNAAGIGGGQGSSGSNITITGGVVVAKSAAVGDAKYGAGIGGGANGSDILVSGGVVTAIGDLNGAGIGGAKGCSGTNIQITGGSVRAIGGANANDIGGGFSQTATTPTNGTDNVYLFKLNNPNSELIMIDGKLYPRNHTAIDAEDKTLYAYLTDGEHEVIIGDTKYIYTYDTSDNSFKQKGDGVKLGNDRSDWEFDVAATAAGSSLTFGTDYLYANKKLVVLSDKGMKISNKDGVSETSHSIIVDENKNANITLAGVNIKSDCAFAIDGDSRGNVTLNLQDGTKNILTSTKQECPGLQKKDTGKLTINGDGALVVSGAQYAAGIGSGRYQPCSNITINGGVITATGGWYGAGIGGGCLGPDTNIRVNGGSVRAISGANANDIGGGHGGFSEAIKNDDGENVYLFVLANTSSATVEIDGKSYPSNHMAADENDKNLYVYLTGEHHTFSLGDKPGCCHFKDNTLTVCVFDKTALTYKVSDATCTEKAVYHYTCICGEKSENTFEYGSFDLTKHTGKKEWTVKNETQHEQKWSCCETPVVELEAHEWKDGVCEECGYVCQHSGGTANCQDKAKCKFCGEKYGETDAATHAGTRVWTVRNATQHEQKWSCCETPSVELEAHEWKDGVCEECGYVCQHSGGTASCKDSAECEYCGEKYGEADATTHAGTKVWTVKNETHHEQKWECCGVVTVLLESHEWKNGVCEECGYVCQHSGGTATCCDKAECEHCGEEYGELDNTKHIGKKVWITDEDKHVQKWDCCGTAVTTLENHEWKNGVCEECGYVCQHSGGTATCCDKAECEHCGEKYGKLNATGHSGKKIWIKDENSHKQMWDCCNTIVVMTASHEWENGACEDCGYVCQHTDGIKLWTTKDETHHEQKWSCCGAIEVSHEGHEWKNGVCVDCGYTCRHSGGTATCKEKARCEHCGAYYGDFDPDNHTGEAVWSANSETHEQKWDCCGKIVTAEKDHSFRWGTCETCGYVHNLRIVFCICRAVWEAVHFVVGLFK